jgi:hypothetical protein
VFSGLLSLSALFTPTLTILCQFDRSVDSGVLLRRGLAKRPGASRRAANFIRDREARNPVTIAAEEHFLTLSDVATRLKVNEDTVRRLFINEPGVVIICFPRKGKRVYRTLRIPEHVFHRVLTRLTRVPA